MTIFTVTTLHFADQKYGSSPRTVGWYSDFERARQCVLENRGDIWECSYSHAVIEELNEGLYPDVVAEHWFAWKLDPAGYQPCEKPHQLEDTCNFSIG